MCYNVRLHHRLIFQELCAVSDQENNVRTEQAGRATFRGGVQGVHDEPQQDVPGSFFR